MKLVIAFLSVFLLACGGGTSGGKPGPAPGNGGVIPPGPGPGPNPEPYECPPVPMPPDVLQEPPALPENAEDAWARIRSDFICGVHDSDDMVQEWRDYVFEHGVDPEECWLELRRHIDTGEDRLWLLWRITSARGEQASLVWDPIDGTYGQPVLYSRFVRVAVMGPYEVFADGGYEGRGDRWSGAGWWRR